MNNRLSWFCCACGTQVLFGDPGGYCPKCNPEGSAREILKRAGYRFEWVSAGSQSEKKDTIHATRIVPMPRK